LIVTVKPETLHTEMGDAVTVGVKPDDAVGLTVNDGSATVFAGTVLNVNV
jgi:hypothetical protein